VGRWASDIILLLVRGSLFPNRGSALSEKPEHRLITDVRLEYVRLTDR
jgi:hypothetical protein